MRIGMLVAVDRELEALRSVGEDMSEEVVAARTVYRFELEGNEVFAVRSGCGAVDAAAGTMLLIARYDCEVIINFGATGALREDLKVNDLFIVEKAYQYDFDTSAVDPVKPGQYIEYPDEFIPLDTEVVDAVKERFPELKPVVAASGNRFVADREEKIRLRNMGCAIVDMEVGAIARVCERCKICCVSVKCISDTFDGDGRDFNTNINRSAEKAYVVLRKMLRAAAEGLFD